MKKPLFIILLLSSIIGGICQIVPEFEHYYQHDGLPGKSITSIIQDSKGFIWIGTQNGLSKWDGYSHHYYLHSITDSNSIAHNTITNLFLDSKDNIWVCTRGGVSVYNRKLDNFKNYIEGKGKNNIGNQYCKGIYEDSQGKIWIGHWDGCSVFDPETNSFKHILIDYSDKAPLVHAFCELENNDMLVGTWRLGLYLYTAQTKTLKSYNYLEKDPTSLAGNSVRAIKKINHEIYIGTWGGGLCKVITNFDHTLSFKQYWNKDDVQPLSFNQINDIETDKDKKIWIASEGGISLFNPEYQSFKNFTHSDEHTKSLTNKVVLDLYIDKNNCLWAGTANGLNYFDPNQKQFHHIKYEKGNTNSLSNNYILSLYAENDSIFWIGTRGGGLNRVNIKTNEFEHYFGQEWIHQIAPLSDKNIILVTRKGTLIKLNTKTRHIANIFINNSPNSMGNHMCINQQEDIFWDIHFEGIFKHNQKTGENSILKYKDIKSSRKIWGAKYIYCTQDNKILIGGYNGIFELDFDNKSAQPYSASPDTLISYEEHVFFINENNKGEIIAGTDKGMLIFSKEKMKILNINTSNGLPNNTTHSIVQDHNNDYWIASDKGLTKYNLTSNTAQNFYIEQGLQGYVFNPTAYKTQGGILLFGGQNGANYFHPDSIKIINTPPKIVLSNLKINNKTIDVSDQNTTDEEFSLPTQLGELSELTLSHREKVITIEFTALSYTVAEKDQFKYKLEGFDDDWVHCGNERKAHYTSLPPGDYTFLVTGANYFGKWSDTPTQLNIKILPPYWKSLWFRSLSSVFILLIIFIIYRIRVVKIRKLNIFLKEKIDERTTELRDANSELVSQKEEITQQNEELLFHRNYLEELVSKKAQDLILAKEKAELSDKLKTEFLSNMSHEIRTPMNAIVGFLELMKSPSLANEERLYYTKLINQSSYSLLRLIDDILDFSKMEAGEITIRSHDVKIYDICTELYSIFSNLLKDKEKDKAITLYHTTSAKLQKTTLISDELRIQQILSNLLDNAIKYTEEGKIEFGFVLQKEKIIFSVSDTGCGISMDKKDIIFERFRKFNTSEKKMIRGVGLGLTLSKRLVEILGGDIWVESEAEDQSAGKAGNSTFYFSLPLIQSTSVSKNQIRNNSSTKEINLKGKKILVAEDEIQNAIYIEKILSSIDVEVIKAENGEQAVQLFSQFQPDLVLMDIKMPRKSGIKAFEEIRKFNKDIPIIAQTAFAMHNEKETILKKGFNDYIAKPFPPSELLKIIQKNIL